MYLCILMLSSSRHQIVKFKRVESVWSPVGIKILFHILDMKTGTMQCQPKAIQLNKTSIYGIDLRTQTSHTKPRHTVGLNVSCFPHKE